MVALTCLTLSLGKSPWNVKLVTVPMAGRQARLARPCVFGCRASSRVGSIKSVESIVVWYTTDPDQQSHDWGEWEKKKVRQMTR